MSTSTRKKTACARARAPHSMSEILATLPLYSLPSLPPPITASSLPPSTKTITATTTSSAPGTVVAADAVIPHRLYIPSFVCAVCFDEFGVVPGMVPVVFPSCGKIGHIHCWKCIQKHKSSKNGAYTCPRCNQLAGEEIVLVALVDKLVDKEAAAIIDKIQAARAGTLDAVLEQSKKTINAQKEKTVADIKRLFDFRVAAIVNNVSAVVASMRNPISEASWSTIQEQGTNLRLEPDGNWTADAIARALKQMVQQLRPAIQKQFAPLGIVVTLPDEQWIGVGKKKKFVYLRHIIDISAWLRDTDIGSLEPAKTAKKRQRTSKSSSSATTTSTKTVSTSSVAVVGPRVPPPQRLAAVRAQQTVGSVYGFSLSDADAATRAAAAVAATRAAAAVARRAHDADDEDDDDDDDDDDLDDDDDDDDEEFEDGDVEDADDD